MTLDHRSAPQLPSTLDLVSKVILVCTALPPCCLANRHVEVWGTGSQSGVRCANIGTPVCLSRGYEQLFNSFLLWLSSHKTGIVVAPTSPGRGSTRSLLGALSAHTCAWCSQDPVRPCLSHCTRVCDLSVSTPRLRTKPLNSSSRADLFPPARL